MKNSIAIFFTGIGIGILLGLSDSPVLLQVLVPLLAIIVGLLSIFTGQKNYEASEGKESNLSRIQNVSALPIMLMVIGMVSGAFLGMLARNYDICSPPWVSNPEKGNPINVIVLNQETSDSSKTAGMNDAQAAELIHLLKNSSNNEVRKAFGLGNANKLKENVRTADESKTTADNPKRSGTVMHGTQSELCNSKICKLSGAALVAELCYSDHVEIKRIINSPIINTDSLKSKVNQICKCKN